MVRKEIIPHLNQSNKGQVYAVIPSVVSRAKKTREIFEEELESNLDGENYQMVEVKDLESIKALASFRGSHIGCKASESFIQLA